MKYNATTTKIKASGALQDKNIIFEEGLSINLLLNCIIFGFRRNHAGLSSPVYPEYCHNSIDVMTTVYFQ